MPPKKQHIGPARPKPLEQVVEEVGLYPADAYDFVQRGLTHAVQRIHGDRAAVGDRTGAGANEPAGGANEAAAGAEDVRHVSGRQLCQSLREYALGQWGLLARTVLQRWNVTSTLDFGRIVFALVDAGHMQKTEDDRLDDFRAIFDFRDGFDAGYRIEVTDGGAAGK